MSKKTYFDYGKNNKPEYYGGFLSGSVMTMSDHPFDPEMLNKMFEDAKKIGEHHYHSDPFTNVSLSGRAIMERQENGERIIKDFEPILTSMGKQIFKPEYHAIFNSGNDDMKEEKAPRRKFDLFQNNFFDMLEDIMADDDVEEVKKVFLNATVKTLKYLKNNG